MEVLWETTEIIEQHDGRELHVKLSEAPSAEWRATFAMKLKEAVDPPVVKWIEDTTIALATSADIDVAEHETKLDALVAKTDAALETDEAGFHDETDELRERYRDEEDDDED